MQHSILPGCYPALCHPKLLLEHLLLAHSFISSNPSASPARGWGILQPSKICAQLAHISLSWSRELTLLCITNEPDGSQATCAILPALSEVLFCCFQCPLLCAIFLNLLFVPVGSQYFSAASLAIRSLLFPIVTPYYLHCSEILLIPLLCSQIMFCRALDCFFPPRFFSESLCSSGCLAASPLVGTSCSQVSILPLWHWDCMNGSGIKSSLRLWGHYLFIGLLSSQERTEPYFLPARLRLCFPPLRNKLVLCQHFPTGKRGRSWVPAPSWLLHLLGVMDVPTPDTTGACLLASIPGPLHASSCTFSATSKISQQQSPAQ